MTYTVKFKLKNQWFFRTIKSVKGDLLPPEMPGVRVFILDNEGRIEIPIEGTVFWFSEQRFMVIKKNMEKEVGQAIVTNSKT